MAESTHEQINAEFERLNQQMVQAFYYGSDETPVEFTGFVPVGVAPQRSARYEQLVAVTRRVFYGDQLLHSVIEWDGCGPARKKSIELLKSWLSPEQLKQFETDGTFEVKGEHSRKTYRIDQKSAYNVVDSKGTEFCFVPYGAAGVGDTMLAQKIALETDERQALKIANKKKPPGSLFNGWFGA